MLLVPVQGLDSTFLYLSFAQPFKILSKFSKLSAILKHSGKNFVMMTSIVICPLIDHRREPIKRREELVLLYKCNYNTARALVLSNHGQKS